MVRGGNMERRRSRSGEYELTATGPAEECDDKEEGAGDRGASIVVT